MMFLTILKSKKKIGQPRIPWMSSLFVIVEWNPGLRRQVSTTWTNMDERDQYDGGALVMMFTRARDK